MEYEEFKKIKNLRQIEDNEIVFDVDNRGVGFKAINFIAINLFKNGYKFEIYYAEGQKSPHLHIKGICNLELGKEQLRKYKELVLKKYTPKEYLDSVDFSLCPKHLVAEENKPHFKYKTIKKLLSTFNKDKDNFAEEKLIERVKKVKERKTCQEGSGITAQIIQKISIIDVARRYGLDVQRNKCFCCFHDDVTGGTPSLVFYEDQGRFFCFGCQTGGNLIDFIYNIIKNNGVI